MSIILTEVRRERVAVVERRGTIVEEAEKTDENAQADAATPRSTAPRSITARRTAEQPLGGGLG